MSDPDGEESTNARRDEDGSDPLSMVTPEERMRAGLFVNMVWAGVLFAGAVIQNLYVMAAGVLLMVGYLVGAYGPLSRTSLRENAGLLPYLVALYVMVPGAYFRDWRVFWAGNLMILVYAVIGSRLAARMDSSSGEKSEDS